ncbi:MAG: hypothetical protein KDD47_21780 [Acidobacteria bacterium]|nr:hypothetical protein [Acidobacteriota bacterium]
MNSRCTLVACLTLVLLTSVPAFAAEPEAPATEPQALAFSAVGSPFEVAPELAFGEERTDAAVMAGCSLSLDDKGVGATCSCSASGKGASCQRQGNKGNRGSSITCTDSTGTIKCSYNKTGTSCGCS